MLRAILKLIAVGTVIALLGIAETPEMFAAGGGALLVLPFAVVLIDRRKQAAAGPTTEKLEVPMRTGVITLDVIPLPTPELPQQAPVAGEIVAEADVPDYDMEDLEGMTMRAPMTAEQAYELHARYAPGFDQQLALERYLAKHGDADAIESPAAPSFDQGRYASALSYADAFEEQLTKRRRTSAYGVAAPRRIARGSYSPQQYRAADIVQLVRPRSDRRVIESPEDWDSKTLLGVKPTK